LIFEKTPFAKLRRDIKTCRYQPTKISQVSSTTLRARRPGPPGDSSPFPESAGATLPPGFYRCLAAVNWSMAFQLFCEHARGPAALSRRAPAHHHRHRGELLGALYRERRLHARLRARRSCGLHFLQYLGGKSPGPSSDEEYLKADTRPSTWIMFSPRPKARSSRRRATMIFVGAFVRRGGHVGDRARSIAPVRVHCKSPRSGFDQSGRVASAARASARAMTSRSRSIRKV
jgi:hypothetical protein